MSSDLKVTNIKHESSSSNNLVLGSDGSATIANGTLSSGTINSAVAIQQKTAVLTGETTAGGLDPSKEDSNNYTLILNTEQDPYNFVTLSSNTVTVTEAGTYFIQFNSGPLLGYQESGVSAYCKLNLEKNGSLLKVGQQILVPDIYDDSSDWTVQAFGNYLGTLAANDELKIRGYVTTADFEIRSWTAGQSQNVGFAYMLIQKIG